MYTVTVKTDGTKTVQSKSYNDLLTFQLHLIIDLVLTQRKLAHGSVKFPARSISHFAMNIIMAKTGSTAKVNTIMNRKVCFIASYMDYMIDISLILYLSDTQL